MKGQFPLIREIRVLRTAPVPGAAQRITEFSSAFSSERVRARRPRSDSAAASSRCVHRWLKIVEVRVESLTSRKRKSESLSHVSTHAVRLLRDFDDAEHCSRSV